MSTAERLIIYILVFIGASMYTANFIDRREPPIHCRYLVKVADNPEAFKCSQYPRLESK